MPIEIKLSNPTLFINEIEKYGSDIQIRKHHGAMYFSVLNIDFTFQNGAISARRLTHKVAYRLVYMIGACGIHKVEVSGDRRYCREIWLVGSTYGVLVNGYPYNKADETALRSRIAAVSTFH